MPLQWLIFFSQIVIMPSPNWPKLLLAQLPCVFSPLMDIKNISNTLFIQPQFFWVLKYQHYFVTYTKKFGHYFPAIVQEHDRTKNILTSILVVLDQYKQLLFMIDTTPPAEEWSGPPDPTTPQRYLVCKTKIILGGCRFSQISMILTRRCLLT